MQWATTDKRRALEFAGTKINQPMKSKKGSLATSLFLISTFVLTTLNQARPVAAGQRARRLETPNQTPQTLPARTPSPSPTPVPLGPPQPIEAPPTTTLPRSNTTTRSVAELQTRITDILRKPELSSAMVGIKVTPLDTGRVLFEENAQ